MTIGERLLKLRKERNLSQEDLANVLDVSRQTISKWETDQSTPDFDKIIPLCNYFGITSDELLTGVKNIEEDKDDKFKSKFAMNIAISVMLYILSIVFIILFAAVFEQPVIGVCVFFVFVAMATGLIIYNSIFYSKKTKDSNETKQNTLVKQVINIVDIIGVIIYLFVSFTTMAWHLTWLIWVIYGLVEEILKLIISMKGDNKNE